MIEFGGITYFIDIFALDKAISPIQFKPTDKVTTTETKIGYDFSGGTIGSEVTEYSSLRGKEIDTVKYEAIRLMLEVIMDYDEETDDSLGIDRAFAKTPLAFKIAFNTLYNYGIIKEKED